MGTFHPPDPSSFPDPHVWATFIRLRSKQFRTHSNLGMAKNAIAGVTRGGHAGRILRCDAYVYRWDDESCRWEQAFFVAEGDDLDASELYRTKSAGRPIKGPSAATVAKTIASITGKTEEV